MMAANKTLFCIDIIHALLYEHNINQSNLRLFVTTLLQTQMARAWNSLIIIITV